MILERFVCGRARSNAYLVAPAPGGPCLVVDAGAGAAERVVRRAEELGLEPVAVLLTHGHPDHTWTARVLSDRWRVPVYLHRADWRWFDEPVTGGYVPLVRLGGRLLGRVRGLRPHRLHPVDGHQDLELGGVGVHVLHTPGHTAGSACFLVGDLCFVGDTVFAGGLGHWAYPGGERRALLQSVRQEILALGDEVRLLPGHGPPTSVGRERATLQRATGR